METMKYLVYILPVTLQNKAHEVTTYAFLDPGSTLVMISSKTAKSLKNWTKNEIVILDAIAC